MVGKCVILAHFCSVCVTSRPPSPMKKMECTSPLHSLLFSSHTCHIAWFYDPPRCRFHSIQPLRTHSSHYCLSSSHLLPYLPFFSLLHTSITQCVHVCIFPNPTQPNPAHQNRVLLFIPPSSSSSSSSHDHLLLAITSPQAPQPQPHQQQQQQYSQKSTDSSSSSKPPTSAPSTFPFPFLRD